MNNHRVNMRRILIITDSLGFPRKAPECVRYQDTYVARLKARFPRLDIIHQGRGGGTIDELFDLAWYYQETLHPDIVFIQSGIVDCAPRALARSERQFISLLPLLRKGIFFVVRKSSRLLRATRQITYTSIDAYADYVQKFNHAFKNVYWIGIVPAPGVYEAMVPGIQANIKRFNQVLRQHKYLSTEHFSDSDVISDFHHLSANGHHKLFDQMATVIAMELEPNEEAGQQAYA